MFAMARQAAIESVKIAVYTFLIYTSSFDNK